MSYHSTPENRHFGASFTSVGDVEAKISMSLNIEKIGKRPLIYFPLYTPYGIGEINI